MSSYTEEQLSDPYVQLSALCSTTKVMLEKIEKEMENLDEIDDSSFELIQEAISGIDRVIEHVNQKSEEVNGVAIQEMTAELERRHRNDNNFLWKIKDKFFN